MLNSCRCRTLFDIAGKAAQVAELTQQSLAEGFWDDPAAASQVMKALEAAREDVATVTTLEQSIADLAELADLATTPEEEQEIASQYAEVAQTVAALEFQTLLSGPYDDHDAIVTIHAGAGGDDAQDWAEMLLRLYLRWAERKDYKATIVDRAPGAVAGIKSATIEMSGRWAYGYLHAEAGVHRLVRLSPFNADNLRQTSFARVEVLPVIAQIPEVDVADSDLKIDTYRSSGAGGQSVNTTDSAVRITHIPTGIVAACQNERSQMQNKEQALKILTAKLHQKYLDEQAAAQQALRGEQKSAEWGSQIRSYVLHPYKMVKDHRTQHETAQTDAVLDGAIDDFIDAFLRQQTVDKNQ